MDVLLKNSSEPTLVSEQQSFWGWVDEPRVEVEPVLKRTADPKQRAEPRPAFWDWVGDRVLTSYAMTRPWIGDFFEEATCELTGAQRLKTDASCICPDLLLPNGVYVECKGVGRSNQSLVYKHRVDKYDAFMAEGNKLVYVFWRHKFQFPEGSKMGLFHVRAELAKMTYAAIFVPAEKVHEAVRMRKPRQTSYSGTKANPKSYHMKPAYPIRSGDFKSWTTPDVLGRMVNLPRVYGNPVTDVAVLGEESDAEDGSGGCGCSGADVSVAEEGIVLSAVDESTVPVDHARTVR